MQDISALLPCATGISCHSAEIKPGGIFVAITGRTLDGNQFAAQAQAQGAIAVITDDPAHLPALHIPVFTVDNARKALAQLAAAFYGHPSHELKLTGVTGSNGKTTVTYMLDHIFRCSGYISGLIGTIQVGIGDISMPSKLTTPDAASLQRYLAEMRRKGVTHAAMEVSAQGIEMHRVDQVHFSCGVITNVTPDHLDFHGSFENYLMAKTKFLNLLDAQTPLIINSTDPFCRQMSDRFNGQIVKAAINQAADIQADITSQTFRSSQFSLSFASNLRTIAGLAVQSGEISINLPLPGRHNVENALMAFSAALLHGIPPENISSALSTFPGVERRLNVFQVAGVTVIDDTALNPGSIDAVFETFRSFCFRRLTVINAIRGQRGPAINAINAKTLAKWQSELPFSMIVTASTDYTAPADRVTVYEKNAFIEALETQSAQYIYIDQLKQSISCALGHLTPGDALVLLGAQGMDEGANVLLSAQHL